MKKTIRKALFCLVFASLFSSVFAQQPQTSTEPHNGAVVVVHPLEDGNSYFTGGEDGFLTRWSSDGIGERYQVSDLRITSIATSPSSQDVAVAVTDGSSVHKVEVVDWKTSARKYTKQFKEPVLSVSYSAKGRYLFITTGEVQGTYVLNAANGKLIKKIDAVSTKIGLVQTADSEKSAVFYCPTTGQILYFDLTKMQLAGWKFSTESNLEQVVMFGAGEKKNRFLAGIKKGTLYIVDASTGKTIHSAALKNPLIVDSIDKGALYYTTSDASVVLNKISESSLVQKISTPTAIVSPSVVASFTEFSAKKLCSVGSKGELSYVFGLTDGTVFEASKSGSSYKATQLTKKMYTQILDVASFNDKIYLLTASGVYQTSYDEKEIKLVGKNNGQTDFVIVDDTLAVLWSKKTKNSVQKVSLSTEKVNQPVILFTPKANVLKVHLFQRNLVYTLSSSRVGRFNIDSYKDTTLYTGNSVEDAIMLTANTVYVAKAASDNIDSPLISKSLTTGETAPLKVDGYASFAIDANLDEDKNIYGIALKEISNNTVTQVFQYYPAQRKSVTILKFNQEDQDAFVQLEGNVLYTNLGKHQIYSYDLESGKVRMYRRTSSLPKKITCIEDRIVFLNSDGGISWYNPLSQSPMAQWYLTLDGKWVEF